MMVRAKVTTITISLAKYGLCPGTHTVSTMERWKKKSKEASQGLDCQRHNTNKDAANKRRNPGLTEGHSAIMPRAS
ncbi:MAG: hypothetical protein WBZ36_17485 [Candidatus Nitrosopolaris sp.]